MFANFRYNKIKAQSISYSGLVAMAEASGKKRKQEKKEKLEKKEKKEKQEKKRKEMRQEARERETGDMACHKALTDELAGEAKTREANDTVLGTASAEPVQVPCTKCQKLMPWR